DIVGILPRALPNGTISEELAERTPEAMARKIDLVRQGAGERFEDIELSQLISFRIAESSRAAAEQIAAERGWHPDLVLNMPSKFVGPPARIVEVMHQRRERYGLSYLVVSDADMEQFAPILQLVVGH
ncbi:MAG TPA: hypothetical protein VML96_06510, partial [Egibacteraceae bacterium]|nr:hypothetical protein [Egibacteraceae bacterium]